MPTPKHSLLAKTILRYLNYNKFSSYKHAGLLNTQNPVQPTNPPLSNDWCDVTKRAQYQMYLNNS